MKKHRIRKTPPINYFQFSLVIGTGICAYIFPGRLVNSIFLLLLIICIIDGLYFFIARRGLRLDVNGSMPVEKKERYALPITMINQSFLPSTLFYVKLKQSQRLKTVGKDEVGVLLAPKETFHYEISYEAKLSGEDIIGIEWGIVESFFHFYKKKLPLEMYIKVRVLPEVRKIIGINSFFNTLFSDANSERNGNCEAVKKVGEEVGYELRTYQEGDSQKLVHWKLAALRDVYLVREREGYLDQKGDIFLILCPLQQEADENSAAILQDKTVTVLASLVHHFLNREQAVKVACYIDKAWKYIKLQTPSQIHDLQEVLSKYQSIEINDRVDEKLMMKSLLKVWRQHEGIRLMVSAYWNENVQVMITNEAYEQKYTSIIYTGEKAFIQDLSQSQLPLWYIHDEYVIEKV